MKSNNIYILIMVGLITIANISCVRTLDSKCESNTYLNDIEKFKENNQITNNEYKSLQDFLSNSDSLKLVLGRSYSEILFRINFNQRNKEINEELEKKERIRELSKIAFENYSDSSNTIYFGDTKVEVEKKIKSLGSSLFYEMNSILHVKELWTTGFLGRRFKVYIAFDNIDNEERLAYISVKQDISYASNYKYYYIGITKEIYSSLINYFQDRYGKTEHFYPELSSYNVGYGGTFQVAKWDLDNLSIGITMSEKNYPSFMRDEIRYIVGASIHYNLK